MRSGWAVEHGRRGFSAVAAAAVLAGLAAPVGAGPHAARAARAAPAGAITTAAGGAGGPARATRVAVVPCGVLAAGGDLYVSDFHAVRRIAAGTDRLTTAAGVGVRGFFGDRGSAAVAELAGECGMAVDHAGNLLLADAGNNRVRVVAASTGAFYGQQMTAGDIYTVAGDGVGGFAGDGGPAIEAELNGPNSVAVDHAGNLVVTDTFNQRVRVVAVGSGTFYGQRMTAGDIYTVAGDGVQGFSGDGGPATQAALANPPQTVVDGAGNLVIADDLPVSADCQSQVRVVAARSGTFYGQPMTAGDIYTVVGGAACGFAGDGGPGTRARLNGPAGVAVDAAGNLVIADGGNGRVRVLAASTGSFYGQPMTGGDIYTVAGDGSPGFSGDGGPARRAGMSPDAVALDSSGNLVIADEFNSRVRVVAARTGTFYSRPMTAGDIYTIGGNGHTSYSGDRGLATRAQLHTPNGTAVDGAGNILVADTVNNRIRVVAARTGTFYGQPMTGGDIYTIAGDGTEGFTGDGGPATMAQLAEPFGVGVDGAGNVLVADTMNDRVRVVAASTGSFYGIAMTAGDIYTVAGDGLFGFSGDGGPAASAELAGPVAVAADHQGNLVIADELNNRIRVVAARAGSFYGQPMTAGDIYTVAGDGTTALSGDGGPAAKASVDAPFCAAVDAAGNLVITDMGHDRVRVAAARTGTFYGQPMTAGDIYTVAGNGTRGFSGDGGPAASATLSSPEGIAIDSAGNLVFTDFGNNRVRVVAARVGTFYGLAMAAGDIYTIAGNGTAGFTGDGGPATSASLNQPVGVAVTGTGQAIVADMSNNRIRVISP